MVKQGFAVVQIILFTAAVFFSVKLFYEVVEARLDAATFSGNRKQEAGRSAADQRENPINSTQRFNFSAYQPIIERDLFHTGKKSVEEKAVTPVELENLAKTRLSLKLWGTITSTAENAQAVIEDTTKREQGLYRKGDNVQQARIKMILRKKVVLTVNGKDEILEMEDLVDQSHRESIQEPRYSRRDDPEPYNYGESLKIMNLRRKEISDAMEGFDSLMQEIKARPYFENGESSGVLLSGIRKDSIFEDMGLEQGDVIKGANEEKIQSVGDALKFFENLKSASDVELKIQRNGENRIINYRID